MTWKLKTDPENNDAPVIDDQGRIVYIDPDGKELPLDPPQMYNKISELGKENQTHRTKHEEVVKKFEAFKDIEDIAKWKEEADKALEAVANFNDKDWMKAEKVDSMKKQITDAYEQKLKDKDKGIGDLKTEHQLAIEKLNQQIRRLLVSNKFAVSKYFSGGGDKSVTILPSNIAEDHFGKYFQVEEGNDGMPTIKALYANGDPVLSKVNPGEPADFEEAIGLIIDQYPGKESILRGTSGGSGGGGGGGEDETGDSGDLAKLKKQYAEAQTAGNSRLCVTLKNRIFELERKLKAA
ncbi:MAG: hypothetical protein PVG39_00170 [Desulfobacteraceae bacterium]|jgi:hypothetical protein